MQATSTWQITREFTHADDRGRRSRPATETAGTASADNATPRRGAEEGGGGPAADRTPSSGSDVRERAAAGRQTGGHRRFGWLPGDLSDGRPHNHLLDPFESPYLRRAIEMIMAGKSERTVTRWLIDQRVPTVRGGKWTGTTVRNMVSNPAVCGYRVLGGELVRDPLTGEPVVGGWETIATPEEWLRVVRRYAGGSAVAIASGAAAGATSEPGTAAAGPAAGSAPSSPTGARAPERRRIAQTRKYLLSGFLRCGRRGRDGTECGATLVGNPVTRGTPHGSYACTSARCRGLARRMDLVDRTITDMVLDELESRYGGGLADTRNRPDPLLGGFTRQRWAEFDLRQKRIAVAAVVDAVTVRPLPEGRSTRAPFDPALLEMRWTPPLAPDG
ncbi:recombinase family protein [Streptomyces sp. HPF1205]|uniref:recombinase family protein n=1 Tax=Streptomyces sp. HPF1205 TaxID=2873262 RepID=UPI001CED3D93|nr:recombinase family protein [Streptomyces sp. HPF1205]